MNSNDSSSKNRVWRNSTMTFCYLGHPDIVQYDCIVQQDGSTLTVKYDRKGEAAEQSVCVVYTGQEAGPGHWRLSGSDGCDSTLHQFAPESAILEGYWHFPQSQSNDDRGFWRIQLSDLTSHNP
ncbi:hypothetical protein [Corticimicrobacter populi]|uniref:hypothetical protein n=1 Tax=Corticimicrobacter populi TaxID=2175229 RepID=UPI0011B2976A|nr:hypothetical protein [Corticimicrobacter populi]